MLRNLRDLESFAIHATDGVIGQIKDFYFDDESWALRYFVVETGLWHANRRTLISPMAMGTPDWPSKLVPSSLTQQQIRNGPDIDTDNGNQPTRLVTGKTKGEQRRQNDLNLRSVNSILRYHVHATDGDIGHVDGILVDEKIWTIRYIIVNTSNWWLGHEVLLATEWIDDVYCAESMLNVALSRDSIQGAPHYDSRRSMTSEQVQMPSAVPVLLLRAEPPHY